MENTDFATRGLLLLVLQSQAAIRGRVVRSMLPHRIWHTVSYLLTSLGCRFHKCTQQLILHYTTSPNFILASNTLSSCNNTRISYDPFWTRFTFAPINPHPLLLSVVLECHLTRRNRKLHCPFDCSRTKPTSSGQNRTQTKCCWTSPLGGRTLPVSWSL
jgi:hypothetical protein